jgi:hypothetical protein
MLTAVTPVASPAGDEACEKPGLGISGRQRVGRIIASLNGDTAKTSVVGDVYKIA